MGEATAVWTGRLTFGLVNLPVKLYKATERHRLSFHELHRATGNRVRRKRVDAETGREVPYEDLVKGYPVGEDEYVHFDPEELSRLEPESSRAITLETFVREDEIDPVYHDRTYYLAPADPEAQRAYRLLAEALEASDRVGVAQFVMRNRSYLAAVRPYRDGLVLTTLFYDDEVRPFDHLVQLEPGQAPSGHEVQLAQSFIHGLAGSFDPSDYQDTYHDRVQAYLERKAEGAEELPAAGPELEPEPTRELAEALEATLGQRQSRTAVGRYESLSLPALRAIARARGLEGVEELSRRDLIEALTRTGAGAETQP